jgi:hypothetical protein
VTAFCQALRVSPGRAFFFFVVPVKLTFEKMAAVMYIASVSILRIPPCLSVGRATGRSGCGMWERARSSRSSRATGDCILRKVASLPAHRGRGVDSGGERRRRPLHMCSLTFEKMAAMVSTRSPFRSTARFSRAAGMTARSSCGTQTRASA